MQTRAESTAPEPGEKPPYIGGQAVLEGVMMRSPSSFAVVVRAPGGELRFRERPVAAHATRWKALPLVRGVASLVEALRLGNEALRFSVEVAEASGDGDGPPNPAAGPTAVPITRAVSAFALAIANLGAEPVGAPKAETKPGGGVTGALMVVAALALFVALPQATAALVDRAFALDLPVQSARFQALTGLFKLVVVIGYLSAIRRIEEIRRMFQYHGAEHKAISTYEAGLPLTVEAARPFTTRHPRCGTTFLVLVALVSVVAFTAVGAFLPRIATGNPFLDNLLFFFEKLPFVPLLAGLTFELQRLTARNVDAAWVQPFLVPGYLVQGITTIPPDDSQLEVALASLRLTLEREHGAVRGTEARAGVYAPAN